ncbi:hypothetical protein KUTeg_010868 [Tegillarca granosa]|uniref:Ion transport domain-containing protein n=1 Tax=Tegillarca granosa TaxID=220873 RepID=A0ABQ9F283_TEGGR|nr:hypothetical protein KUTeg_010868 [Tegillarca granosa]
MKRSDDVANYTAESNGVDEKETRNKKELWFNMTNKDFPRIVLSITGSKTRPHQKKWSFENLHKAIYDTTRKCMGCALLFNKERTPEIEMITKTLTNLPEPLQSWSYSKSLKKMTDVNSSTEVSASSCDKNDNETIKQETVKCEDYIKLVEFESFINNRKIESTTDVLARAMLKDLSVTVIKGTGGTADLLATCYDSLHNLPRKIPTILGIRMDDDLYSRIIRVMKIIHEKHWLINTFDLENDDEHVLWTRVTNGIIRAWSLENVKVSEVDLLTSKPIFDSEGLSVSKYVTNCDDVSKEEIFEGFKVERKGSEDSQKLQKMQHDESVDIKQKVSKCIDFWKKVDKKTFETLSKEDNNAEEYKAAAESIHYTLLKGGTKCCMPCCVKPSEEKKDKEPCRNSDLLLQCMVTDTALIVSRAMRALSRIAVEMAEDKWLSKELDGPETTAKALTQKSKVWGMKASPTSFSNTFDMEEFSAHSVAHKHANRILYGVPQKNTSQDSNQIMHIAVLVCYSIFLITDVRMETISSLIIVVFVFVVGDLYEEFKFLKRRVWKHVSMKIMFLHFCDIWRSMDLLFWILFLIGFFMHASKIEELYLHTRRIYSVALFFMFMRLFKMMLMIRSLGIMVIMIKEMLKDVLKFLVVASIFMFAAGIIYHANIYPNHTYSEFSFDNWRFWQLLKIPYWQIYGELYLDTLEGSAGADCTDNEEIWSSDPTAERCSENDWFAIFIAAVYMMLVNWLLLNIVIAMFSMSEYRAHQSKNGDNIVTLLSIDYQRKIPSPINLIIRPILYFYRKEMNTFNNFVFAFIMLYFILKKLMN